MNQIINSFYGSIQLLIVLQFTYVVLILRGINKMVDVLTNRIFDTYNRFSPQSTTNHDNPTINGSCQNDALATLTTLKRYAKDERCKKQLSREADIKRQNAQLFEIKENVQHVKLTRRRPFLGLCCQNCTASSRESLVNKTTKTLALKNILNYRLPLTKNGIFHRIFSHFYQVYELKKFRYPQVADLVLHDDRLRKAIEKTALEHFQDSDETNEEFHKKLVHNNERRAAKLLDDMKSSLSDFLLRFTSWILYKLLPCFLQSVVVHPGQIDMLKKAGESNLPLIFLPLHRSHLDYILVSFILLNNDVRCPLVAAGDNLRIPFFGSILRGLGAFFIKRRVDPVLGRRDHVYKAVLHTYMNCCLRAGHNVEFFLEGGRTRTGKPCMPKYGILSVVVDSFMDGTIEDALLVPVSVNYDRLVDGNFVREQLGQPKQMETFANAVKGIWNVLNSNYGTMRIDFNQPFSLRELIKTFNINKKASPNGCRILKSNASTTSLYGTDVVSDEHKALVECISKHVVYDCCASTSIMSTNALAFLLLNRFRDGGVIDDIVVEMDRLRQEFEYADVEVGFSGDSIDVINYACDILGPGLIRKEHSRRQQQPDGGDNNKTNITVLRPIAELPNVIELAYYSNTVMVRFATEAIVAASVMSLVNTRNSMTISAAKTAPLRVNYDTLMDTILTLCDVLQQEFLLCRPCQSLEQIMTSCIDDMTVRKQIFVSEELTPTETESRLRHLLKELENDSDVDAEEDVPQKFYEFSNTIESRQYIQQLSAVIMPLVEAYSVAAFCLDKLVDRQLLEEELLQCVLEESRRRLDNGTYRYGENVSVDSIKNAFKLFQKWDILECHNEKKMRLYYLKDDKDSSEAVKEVYQKIDRFRNYVVLS